MFVDNLAEVYKVIGRELLENGEIVRPRGRETKELLTPVIHLKDPRSRLCYCEGRNFSIVYAIVESLMLFSSKNGVQYFSTFNKNMENFSDDGASLHGCYGKRIAEYIPSIVRKLKSDKDSRQAIINIYNSNNDSYYCGKDTPCTLALNFIIRNNKLNMIVYMRSNDIIWGLPYDIYMFTTMQEVIANELGIDLGFYRHIPTSLHVYSDHYNLLETMVNNAKPINPRVNSNNVCEWSGMASEYVSIIDSKDVVFNELSGPNELNIIKNEILYRAGKSPNLRFPSFAYDFTKRWRKQGVIN